MKENKIIYVDYSNYQMKKKVKNFIEKLFLLVVLFNKKFWILLKYGNNI